MISCIEKNPKDPLRSASPRPLHMPLGSASRLSRLELIGGSGRTAGHYASAARAFISPTAFEQARGGALGAGGGRVGGRVCWGRPLLSRPRGAVGSGPAAVESAAVSAVAWSCGCVPAPPGVFLPEVPHWQWNSLHFIGRSLELTMDSCLI